MWTLVIVILMGSPSSIGGAGIGVNTAISTLDFPTQEKCEEAGEGAGHDPAGAAVAQRRGRRGLPDPDEVRRQVGGRVQAFYASFCK